MPRREKCRYCENERKEGVEWYDDDYCSGKCAKADGETIPPAAKPSKSSRAPGSFADYILDYPPNLGEKDARGQRIKGRMPKLYRRRFEAEKLNWGEPLSEKELLQAGLRANREPIPGDWDYEGKSALYSCKKCNRIVEIPENDMPESDELYCMACLLEKDASSHDAPLNDWNLIRAKAKELGIKTHGKKREQIKAEILDVELHTQEKENG